MNVRIFFMSFIALPLISCNSLLGIGKAQSCFSLRDFLLENPETVSYLEKWVDTEVSGIIEDELYDFGHFGMYPGDARVRAHNFDVSKLHIFSNDLKISLNLGVYGSDRISYHNVNSVNFAERSRAAISVKLIHSPYYYHHHPFPRKSEDVNRYIIDISDRVAVLCDF